MERRSFNDNSHTIDLRAKHGIKIIIMIAVWDFFEFIFKGFKIHDFLWVVSVLLFMLPFWLISRKRRSGIPLFFMVNAAQIALQAYVCMKIDDHTPFPFFRLLCSVALILLALELCFFKSNGSTIWKDVKHWKW